jgi:hypothetical protein
LSSTTDPAGQRGQILVLFAGALVTLLIVAALAFDVGMMLLERRDQQNAADAAALAGARYVLGSSNYSGSCAGASGNAAVAAACDLAQANGYSDADAHEEVSVHIPPLHGVYAGFDGFLEVTINASRPSIFGGVIGRAVWPVGAYAVAGDQDGVTYSFGMLALDPTACKALQVAGTGVVNSASNIQSNSNGSGCGTGDPYGFSRSGGGTLNLDVTAVCRSVSLIQDVGSGFMTCSQQPNSFALPDPLRKLPAPAKPPLATAMKEVVAGVVVNAPATMPKDCPGATGGNAPSETSPVTCVLGQGGTQANRSWILYPGLYPGGLDLKGGVTAFLMPGIYWIGGGGFQAAGDVSVISVESETNRSAAVCTTGSFCTGGGGVLIYNSKLGNKAAGPIGLGGSGATLSLMPFDYSFGDSTIDLVIFQDRTVPLTVTLNGSSSQATQVRGIVYVPLGEVKVNGSDSAFTMDQVIADTFYISGSGGTVNVLRETGVDAEISGVGLVE